MKKSWSFITSIFFAKKLSVIPNYILEKAKLIGKAMHYILQSTLLNQEPKLLSGEKILLENMRALILELKNKKVELIKNEFCLEDNNYIAFIDCVFKLKNEIELLEFKSKSKSNINKLDTYNALQIMFYKWLFYKIYKPKKPLKVKISLLQACKTSEAYIYIFLNKEGLKKHFKDYDHVYYYLKYASKQFIKLVKKIKSENDFDNFYELNKFLEKLKPYFVIKKNERDIKNENI